MYSKEEASKVKAQFWTSFGQYMKPISSAAGLPINWINYKTGIKYIQFKMDADNKEATIAIEISHPQQEQRLYCYNHFLSLKKLLETTTGFVWQWNEMQHTEHKTISSISQQLDDIKVLNQDKWPAIISFLKPRIIALDAFWELVKDGFE
jgi:Domain of unknown function (DUF4268)